MTVSIREAEAQDSDTVWNMLRPVFRAGETYAVNSDVSKEAALDYWFAGRAYIAQDASADFGTYYIQENRPGGGSHYCNCGFVTASNAQGRGIARTMLEDALVRAKNLGFQGMVFNFVVSSNTRAVALWKQYGFDVVGSVPGAFHPAGQAHAADALVMFKRL